MKVNMTHIKKRTGEIRFIQDQINIRMFHLSMSKKTQSWVKELVTNLIILRDAGVNPVTATEKLTQMTYGTLNNWLYHVQQSWKYVTIALTSGKQFPKAEMLFMEAHKLMVTDILSFVYGEGLLEERG